MDQTSPRAAASPVQEGAKSPTTSTDKPAPKATTEIQAAQRTSNGAADAATKAGSDGTTAAANSQDTKAQASAEAQPKEKYKQIGNFSVGKFNRKRTQRCPA